ncbi:pseudouridine synthase [Niastella yeongjuensis]|uniref:Pseudouridine synthase n=1 Tax=Niastella yeongjuensis TaxID=354355 RepID=A0A1V9EX55_9BACT|nr:pseudouridine synthase [Niastella yeongjuensis]OQP50709.1 pseudouridine synthase [Niastella yeongjuensis]SEN21554.1 23S rRNA pseudouridine2457 synthase [Niastella yeongjuensis]
MHRYFIIYKPYQVLSQFTSEEGKHTLKTFFTVPADVYAVGRLDYDSEGILILTNDTSLNNRLLNPSFAHEREYWVQVDGDIHDKAIQQLQSGVTITINGSKYRTLPCKATRFAHTPPVPERNPPIRYRKEIPTSWVKLILTEGKNRQVRKMTAQTGFPTLRLIRYRIGGITLDGLLPGEMREMNKNDIYTRLFG